MSAKINRKIFVCTTTHYGFIFVKIAFYDSIFLNVGRKCRRRSEVTYLKYVTAKTSIFSTKMIALCVAVIKLRENTFWGVE